MQRLIPYVNISFELEYNLDYAHCKCGDPVGLCTIVCHGNHNIILLEDLRTYLSKQGHITAVTSYVELESQTSSG